MPGRQKGRIPEIDLSEEAARALFAGNVACRSRPETIAVYKQLKFRRRGDWAAIYRNRGLLMDAFQASRGRLIRQSSLDRQFRAFMISEGSECSLDESDQVAYRIRAMMSHLRDARADNRHPPARNQALSAVMNIIDVGADREIAEVAEVATMTAAMPITPPMPTTSSSLVECTPDRFPSFVRKQVVVDLTGDASATEDEVSDLERQLFPSPTLSTPEKVSPVSSSPQDIAVPSCTKLTDLEIDKMIGDKTRGPTTAEYNHMRSAKKAKGKSKGKAKGKAKKKAKSTAKSKAKSTTSSVIRSKGVKPLCGKPIPEAIRKRVYSTAWHNERKKLLAGGQDLHIALAHARKAGHDAILHWIPSE